jgi:hypothetical protein
MRYYAAEKPLVPEASSRLLERAEEEVFLRAAR